MGSGSSKVRSVTAGQCSNVRRSSVKCGGRVWVPGCRVRRGWIAPQPPQVWIRSSVAFDDKISGGARGGGESRPGFR